MSDKTVGDLMHRGIIACKPATPMDEVVRIVIEKGVHAILVMDDETKAQGIISHTDIIRFYGQDLSQHTAREVMSGPVQDIEVDQPAELAARQMLDNTSHHLLVIEIEQGERKPVGIISTTDLVKSMRGSRWTWHVG
jgi:CBS domain-containing protein